MVTLTDIQSGYGLVTTINANWRKIESAFDEKLTRVGTAGSQMEANLDMNAKRITNLANATNSSDAVTLAQLLGDSAIVTVEEAISQENIGPVLYPLTSAEAAASILEYDPDAPIVGNIYRPWYAPGNIMRYGADPTGTNESNNVIAIQAAINAALNAGNLANARENAKVVIPDGYFACDADIWCHYHSTENIVAGATWYQRTGDIHIAGVHSAFRWMPENNQHKGSRIHFTSPTANGFIISDPEFGVQIRNVVVEDLLISGVTSGDLVKMRNLNSGGLRNCTIYLDGSGTAWNVDGSNTLMHTNVHCMGTETAGSVGIKNEALEQGGGAQYMYCQVEDFDINVDLGQAYDAAREDFIPKFSFTGGQLKNPGTTSLRVRHGVSHVYFLDTWFEHGTAATGCLMSVSDSGGKNTAAAHNRQGDGLVFEGCLFSTLQNTAGDTQIELGNNTGATDPETSYGNIKFIRCNIGNLGTQVSFIHKWNTSTDGDILFDGCSYVKAGIGYLVKLGVDSEQYGEIIFRDMQEFKTTMAKTRWLVDSTYTDRLYYMSAKSDEPVDIGSNSGTYSYTEAMTVPNIVSSLANGATLTLELPENARTHDFSFNIGFRRQYGDDLYSTLVLDAGALNILSTEHEGPATAQTFIVSKYSQYHIRYDKGADTYIVSLLSNKKQNSFESGINTTVTHTPSSILREELVYLDANTAAANIDVTLEDGVIADQEITFVLETVDTAGDWDITITPDSFNFLTYVSVQFADSTAQPTRAAGDSITLKWSRDTEEWFVKAKSGPLVFA